MRYRYVDYYYYYYLKKLILSTTHQFLITTVDYYYYYYLIVNSNYTLAVNSKLPTHVNWFHTKINQTFKQRAPSPHAPLQQEH